MDRSRPFGSVGCSMSSIFRGRGIVTVLYRNCHLWLCPSDFVNVNLMGTVSIGQYNILFLARNDVQAASRPNSKDSWRQNLAVGDRAESAALYLRRISYLAFGLPTDFPKRVHLNAPLNHPDGVGWGTRVLPPVGWPVHVEVSPSAPLSFSWSDAAWSNWTTGLTEVFLGFIRSFNVKIPILRVFKSVIALGARAHINNSYHHRGCCWSSSSSAH